ncbi:hypothetical protein MBLNU459_g8443t1 [Dothideomycetes sp. NU459]
MDILLGKVTQQAMNYAIRSGIAITSTYAIGQCSRLVKTTPKSSAREELLNLQIRLDSKIRIISPAIDMIELIAARGNTSLESAVLLTKDLRWEIQSLGVRLSSAANEEELLRRRSSKAKSREQNELELKLIISDVRKLLDRIEDAVPLINLAITTSGVNLSANLPATVSPSRLLQASTFLTSADTQYILKPGKRIQVGPVYTLSIYMLFAGHTNRLVDEESIRETTWKEVIHKARVKLVRVPLDGLYALPGEDSSATTDDNTYFPEALPSNGTSSEFAYQLVLVEDLNDDRMHTFEDDEPQPGPFDDVALAGIRDTVPIHQISKIFYADTGKILNIGTDGETNNPILLIKRDINAEPPRRMMEREGTEELEVDSVSSDGSTGAEIEDGDDDQSQLDAQILRDSTPVPEVKKITENRSHSHWRLPLDLDPEWIAFEVYNEEPSSEDESDVLVAEDESRPSSSRQGSVDPSLASALSNLNIRSPTPAASPSGPTDSLYSSPQNTASLTPSGPIKTSLSLLEMLVRLTALQQFRQASHLTIEDELLNFFLEDSATTGAGSNAAYRQRVRRDARRRVGFDPYDESPIKRRGEEYLAHPRSAAEQWAEGEQDGEAGYSSGGLGSPDYARQSIEYPRYSSPGRDPNVPSSPSPQFRHGPVSSTRSSPVLRSTQTPLRQARAAPSFSASKGRQALLRTQSEKPGSPLARDVTSARSGEDSTLGTSPGSEQSKEESEE